MNNFNKISALIIFHEEINDESLIDEAVKNNSLYFLRFIWEQSCRQPDKFTFFFNNKRSNKKKETSKDKTMRARLTSRKSLFMVTHAKQKYNHNYNGRNPMFTVSDLVRKLSEIQNRQSIKYKI